MRHSERGQALVEGVIFLPVALLVLFAVLYFARLGVLEERAQSAVRYGAMVSYESKNPIGAAQIYAALAANAAPTPTCPAGVVTDTLSALDGGQSGTQTQGFWKPDSAVAATCSISTAGFSASGTDAYRYFTVTSHVVGGSLNVPSYVSGQIGSQGHVAATMGYVHADGPATIMYCTSHVGASVAAALARTYTASGSC